MVNSFVMIFNAARTAENQELVSSEKYKSACINSFSDFAPSNSNDVKANNVNGKNDFMNIFIYHLIFYSFFCIALVLYILIDLRLGSFVKNKFLQLIEIISINIIVTKPALA